MVRTRNQEKHQRADDKASSAEEPAGKQAKRDQDAPKSPREHSARIKNRENKDHDTRQDVCRQDDKETGKKRGGTGAARKALRDSGDDSDTEISINRAPVLTLWVAVVGERLGFSPEEAYTYGRWAAATLAQAKGRKLGIFEPSPRSQKKNASTDAGGRREERQTGAEHVQVFAQTQIPVKRVNGKLLAVKGDKTIDPDQTRRYLENKFGENLEHAHDAMLELAQSLDEDEVRNRAYELYEQFRPEWRGWGKKGTLDLDDLIEMADKEGTDH